MSQATLDCEVTIVIKHSHLSSHNYWQLLCITCHDIAYAVYLCVWFTHSPRKSHSTGVKMVWKYLQGTNTKWLILNFSSKLQVNYYIDADFAGLWNTEQDQDHIYVSPELDTC